MITNNEHFFEWENRTEEIPNVHTPTISLPSLTSHHTLVSVKCYVYSFVHSAPKALSSMLPLCKSTNSLPPLTRKQ